MAPLVSVIVPTYNRARLLERAVRSAASQSVRDIEILVCDDGSTDDSQARIVSLGDPRVRWVKGPRGGRPAIPRNRGLGMASGQWVAFLDSDDEWEPRKLEAQLAALEGRSLGGSCTNAWVPGDDGPTRRRYFEGSASGVMGLSDVLAENRIICSSMLLRASVIRHDRFPEEREYIGIEDYALWLRILQRTSVMYLDEPLLTYSTHTEDSVRREENLGAEALRRKAAATGIVESLAAMDLRSLGVFLGYACREAAADLKRKTGAPIGYLRRGIGRILGRTGRAKRTR